MQLEEWKTQCQDLCSKWWRQQRALATQQPKRLNFEQIGTLLLVSSSQVPASCLLLVAAALIALLLRYVGTHC